jgi:hypothetical protein
MVATKAAPGIYDAALLRRQALMGSSGPLALVKNFRVFLIALFACVGGLLYGIHLRGLCGIVPTDLLPRLQPRSLLRCLNYASLPESHGKL